MGKIYVPYFDGTLWKIMDYETGRILQGFVFGDENTIMMICANLMGMKVDEAVTIWDEIVNMEIGLNEN